MNVQPILLNFRLNGKSDCRLNQTFRHDLMSRKMYLLKILQNCSIMQPNIKKKILKMKNLFFKNFSSFHICHYFFIIIIFK